MQEKIHIDVPSLNIGEIVETEAFYYEDDPNVWYVVCEPREDWSRFLEISRFVVVNLVNEPILDSPYQGFSSFLKSAKETLILLYFEKEESSISKRNNRRLECL